MKHLQENNIGYFPHAKRALILSLQLFKLGLCGLIHAIYPDWFQNTMTQGLQNLLTKYTIYIPFSTTLEENNV